MKAPKLKFLKGMQDTARRLDARAETPEHTDAILDKHVAGNVHAPRTITKPIMGVVLQVDLAKIKPDPEQPRRTFDRSTLQQLADSIREYGVLQPIRVRWADSEDVYYIVNGERRYRAATLAGLQMLPAVILPLDYDGRRRREEQLVENIQRENIPPIEEARALKALMDSANLSVRKAAERLGKPASYVAELTQILRLPEELLERTTGLPKQAVVQLSRIKEDSERRQRLEEILLSERPYQTIKESATRAAPKKREQYRASYEVPGLPRLTLILDITTSPSEEELLFHLDKLIAFIRQNPQ